MESKDGISQTPPKRKKLRDFLLVATGAFLLFAAELSYMFYYDYVPPYSEGSCIQVQGPQGRVFNARIVKNVRGESGIVADVEVSPGYVISRPLVVPYASLRDSNVSGVECSEQSANKPDEQADEKNI